MELERRLRPPEEDMSPAGAVRGTRSEEEILTTGREEVLQLCGEEESELLGEAEKERVERGVGGVEVFWGEGGGGRGVGCSKTRYR